MFDLHVFKCTMSMPDAQGGQKRGSEPLGPESHMVVICHVGAESWTRATSSLNCGVTALAQSLVR